MREENEKTTYIAESITRKQGHFTQFCITIIYEIDSIKFLFFPMFLRVKVIHGSDKRNKTNNMYIPANGIGQAPRPTRSEIGYI